MNIKYVCTQLSANISNIEKGLYELTGAIHKLSHDSDLLSLVGARKQAWGDRMDALDNNANVDNSELNSSSTEIDNETEKTNSEQVAFETVESKKKRKYRNSPDGDTNNNAKKLYSLSLQSCVPLTNRFAHLDPVSSQASHSFRMGHPVVTGLTQGKNSNVNKSGSSKDARIIGKSTKGNLILKADKPFTKRRFFYVGNISKCEESLVKEYLQSINVRCISCYPVLRSARKNGNQTDGSVDPPGEGATGGEDARKSKASTAFRVCINEDDVAIFTNVDNWAEDVIIRNRNWEFKDSKGKDNQRNGGNRLGSLDGDTNTGKLRSLLSKTPVLQSRVGPEQSRVDAALDNIMENMMEPPQSDHGDE